MYVMGELMYCIGGASGIGRAVVEMLASRGIRIAIADINFPLAQEVAASIQGNNAIAIHVEVEGWDSQLAAFKQAQTHFHGRIDYVFAVAGVGERKWISNNADATDGAFVKPNLEVLDIDLRGVLYTVGLAVQQMRRQEVGENGFRGKIVVVASVCGFYCVPTLPIYTAAKHGVVGFVRSYGKHLVADSECITLNAICPDVVRTNISTSAFYDEMEALNLVVPMPLVVEAFERCIDGDISGETLEIQPNGGITHRSAPEPVDKDAADSLQMLHKRSVALLGIEKHRS